MALFTPNPGGYLRWTGRGFTWDRTPASMGATDDLMNRFGTVTDRNVRLTPPPMDEPGRRILPPAETYEEAIDQWCTLRGLDPVVEAHRLRAAEAMGGQHCELGQGADGQWRLFSGRGEPVVYITSASPSYTPAPVPDPAPAVVTSRLEWEPLGPLGPVLIAPVAVRALGDSASPVPPAPSAPVVLTPPGQVHELLAGYGGRWWIAGGWSLELWLGEHVREHHDVEIAVPRHELALLREYLAGFNFVQSVAVDGGHERWPLEPGAEPVAGVHELHAQRGPNARRRPLSLLHLEVLLNDIAGETWHYRRNLAVTMPLSQLTALSATGIPCLAPEVVLLYKAGLWRPSNPRGQSSKLSAKDEQDFAAALPRLEDTRRGWLTNAIALAHPGHPWLTSLAHSPPVAKAFPAGPPEPAPVLSHP